MAFAPALGGMLFGYGGTAAFAPTAGLLTSGYTAAALTIGGVAVQAMGARDVAKSEAALFKYNAALDRSEAQQRRVASMDEQQLRRDRMRRVLSKNRASIAKSGTTMGDSNLVFQLEAAENMAADIANLAYGRELESIGLETQAGVKDWQAKSSIRAGKIGVGTALIGGVSDLSKLGIQRHLRQQQARAGVI